jgi:hypothetical protein
VDGFVFKAVIKISNSTTQHSIFTQKRVTNIWTGTNHHHQMKWISLIYFILFYFNFDMDGTKENCSKKQVTLFRWTFFQK